MSSSGNPSASYPFASYYDLWVSGIDPSATEITLRFDRWGENVLWLTVPYGRRRSRLARRPMTPARRKRRTIRMAIALPIPGGAGPGSGLPHSHRRAGPPGHPEAVLLRPREVLTSIDFSRGYNKFKIGQSDRYYILRWGDGMPGAV